MSKTIIGVSFRVNQEKYSFDFTCSWLTDDMWNNKQYRPEILESEIVEEIKHYKKINEITKKTDSGSMEYYPHFYK